MVQTGDWLIATNQGVAILDRPPLQYWALALVHRWIHPLDPLTIRLFMVVVTLGTSLVIWWYSKRFLSEAGAFLAAVAYPTMGHVFDLGRRAETDGLFTMLMAGALMLWHYGYAHLCCGTMDMPNAGGRYGLGPPEQRWPHWLLSQRAYRDP
jgi:4-amino-4-deoxy-L-arabinose transferase-like glycosyltransferase